MEGPGRDVTCVLPDGRTLDYWEGGDPDGQAVVYHGGTPCTRVFGRTGHETARNNGVRLVSLSRPGYGGSTLPPGVPSLLTTGQDTADLAHLLGITEYAVFGASSGGPFAVATAVADRDGVRSLGVVGGIGPWRLLNDPSEEGDAEIEERSLLALLDAGDLAGAWAGYLAVLERDLGGLAELDDDARVDAFFAGMGTSPQDPYHRVLWADNLADVAARLDGCAFDNLAWGGTWDIDPSEVVAPTTLWYGEADVICPPAHGEWYAERIEGAELVVLPREGHVEICTNHWSEELTALLDRWRD
jgi:pimeloyl-ACP methyl ester carboxylesterase